MAVERSGEIRSFICRVVIRDGEAYIVEPSQRMFLFFGTTEESYKNGILARVRSYAGAQSAKILQKTLTEKASLGCDFHVICPVRRADGSACELQIDGYTSESSGPGRVYNLIATDVSELVNARRTSEELSQKLSSTLVDTINRLPNNSAIYRILDDGRSLEPESYSDEFYRMCGYTREEDLFSGDAYGGVHPDDAPALIAFIAGRLADEEPFHAVYRIITRAKKYKWVSVNFNKFRFAASQYLYAQFTDIDDLKKQEQQLAEQYSSAQEFIDSVSDSYLVTRRVNLTRNRVELVNGMRPLPKVRAYDDYELSIRELLNSMPREQDRRECREFYARESLIEAYRAGRKTLSKDYQLLSDDGELLWARCVITLAQRPDSEDVISFSAVSDVSREKIVETLFNGVLLKRYDFIACLNANKNTASIVSICSHFEEEDYIRDTDDYDSAMRGFAGRFVSVADRRRYIEFMSLDNVVRRLDSDGVCAGTFTLGEGAGARSKCVEFFYIDRNSRLIALTRSDVTELQKQQLEQERVLREALSAAQEASRAKSDFLSRMSHDIRTPLNGIIGMAYLAARQANPQETADCLEKIGTSSKFLLGLINDILDMAKAESGKIELHPEPYLMADFDNYIDSVIRPLYEVKNQTFTADTNPVRTVIPIVDILRFNQIMFNLLSNAVKYTPEGGCISLYVKNELVPGHRERITAVVSDNGIGMSEEFQKVLFNPFTQAGRNDVSENRGSGLGLSIAKKMVDLMGGSISVKSKLGEGTTFTVVLDFDYIEAEQATWNRDEGRSAVDYSLLENRHVLLCEDHPLNQEIARKLLEEKDMIVELAENGQRAVELFSRSSCGFYDLVLMDIRMPVMDGYEAARGIRALKRADASSVPIVAMTADAFEDDVAKCLAAGMNSHIAKPVDPEQLYRVVAEAVSNRS